VQYEPGHFPPNTPLRLRWEWTPEQVSIGELYPYYDYVLTRGDGFRPPPNAFKESFRSGKWTVWERVDS
jgi:hypothetical protein